MSQPLPERADFRQLRIQAKELLDALHTHQTEALALAAEHDPTLVPTDAKLADAQRLIARKHGFASWPKMVEEVEIPALLQQMRAALESGDARKLDELLTENAGLRKRLDEPMFTFDSPPIMHAAGHRNAKELLSVLVRHGADPNARSKWWAGGFSALDFARPEVAAVLLELGARYDVWSASAQGEVEELRHLLDQDPSSVNARGGDGQTPLHVAQSAEVAELLLARGGDTEIRDVDHESTPIQYQINRPEVARVLLRHGAQGDVFTAAALDDVELWRKLIDADVQAGQVRIGEPPFVTRDSNGGHIYAYQIGNGKTPLQIAAERKSRAVLAEMEKTNRPVEAVMAAAWLEDAEAVARLLADHPRLEWSPSDSHALAAAAQAGRAETVRLLLQAGADPLAPGLDSGTALHIACWFGQLPCVRLLLDRVPLDFRDSVHGSPPLGWAAHGSRWCRNPKGDYVGVVRALLEAGADVHAEANKGGTSMLDQAGDREDVKAVLREAGAL